MLPANQEEFKQLKTPQLYLGETNQTSKRFAFCSQKSNHIQVVNIECKEQMVLFKGAKLSSNGETILI